MSKKVETGAELITKRTQTVWNTEGGSIVSDGNTGEERIQISGPGGGNVNINNKVNSEFAPNNKQTLVHGNKFETTAGDNFETTKSNKEVRVEQDLTFITGSENFFQMPLAEDWITKMQGIAAAKAAPEYNYGAVGNNTETEYPDSGTPNSDGGSVEGGNYKASDAHADIPALMESQAADIAETEAKMGTGGSIKMMSAKHISLMAGTKAVTFDSGVMVPNARKVVKQYDVTGGACTPVYTAVSTYESKDTSGSVPFGDVHISAAAKLRVVTGSGGVSIKSAGEVNINSTGRLMLGGAEVAIGGSTKGNAGRVTIISDTDVFQEAGVIATRVAPNINDVASAQHTFHTPKGVFTGDLHIKGNVIVEGSTGITVPSGDVVASGVSLVNHTHGGICSGDSNTLAPNGGGSGSSSSGGGGSGGGSSSGVSQIVAGANIAISPTDGTGAVTINATGGSTFSGSYNDLTNVPTTFNTVSSFSGSYNDLTDQPTILDSVATLAIVAAVGYTTCDGTVESVTTGPYLTGGGSTNPEIGIDSACASKWDNAAAGGIGGVTAGAGLSGGGSGGTVTIGIDSGILTPLDQSTCPGINCIGTVVASDISSFTSCTGTLVPADITGLTSCTGTVVASDISSFTSCIGTLVPSDIAGLTNCLGTITTAGALLSAGACTIGVDSGALTYLDQSACLGISCTGDITEVTTCGDYLTGGGLTGAINIGLDAGCAQKWDNASAGSVVSVTATGPLSSTGGTAPGISLDAACISNWNTAYTDSQDTKTCPGIDKIGTVEGVTTSTLLSGGGTSGCFNIGIDSGALTYLDQSCCAGIDCTGTLNSSGLLSNNDFAKFDSLGCLIGRNCAEVYSDLGLGTAAICDAADLDQSACPGIDCTGTVTCVTGGVGIDHTAGPNPELSVDNTVVRTIGNQVVGGTKHFTSATNFLSISATGLITGDSIEAGAFMEANASSSELYSQGTILALNEGGCVVESTEANSKMVFGVAAGNAKAPIVMGAEPVCMTGDIKVGDYITSSNKAGHGKRSTSPYPFGTIIAQAMESGNGESFEIKAMIRKM